MHLLEAMVFGLVRGLGEFLPISSSAHLVLVPWLFGWTDPEMTFDVALHLGTLVAVVIFFGKEWWVLLIAGIKGIGTRDGRLFWYLVMATIPGAAIGFILEDKAETVFRIPLLIAVMLIVMGIGLYWADGHGRKQLRWKTSI